MKLTEAQRNALESAGRVHAEADGVHPRRGQHSMFENLRLRGLIEYVGIGVSSEDTEDRQVHLYRITAAGVRALARPKAT